MSKKILGVTGYKQSGKDTFARVLIEERGYVNIKFADALKDMIRSVIRIQGVSEDEIEDMVEGGEKENYSKYLGGKSPRYAMQTLGTEWGRDIIGEDFWVNVTKNRILSTKGNVIITDMRFHNECDLIKELGGTTVRINRDGISDDEDTHPSEKNIPSLDVDREIVNNSSIYNLELEAFGLDLNTKKVYRYDNNS